MFRKSLLCMAALMGGISGAKAMPTTFGTVIGHAILCIDTVDPGVFQQYLDTHFGPAYKHADGALWFKTPNAKLWGEKVEEVFLSDNEQRFVFIGARITPPPEALAKTLREKTGFAFEPYYQVDNPVRVARTGSILVYDEKKSRLYCARTHTERPILYHNPAPY
jgi:hypothetical protein